MCFSPYVKKIAFILLLCTDIMDNISEQGRYLSSFNLAGDFLLMLHALWLKWTGTLTGHVKTLD